MSLIVSCRPPLPPASGPGPADRDVSGVWDLVEQSFDDDGDERIERQEWQLQQRGSEVLGFCARSRSWVSGDGLPFACSGQPRTMDSWRVLLRGRMERGMATVRVTRQHREPGPCQSEPPLESCRLARGGRVLLVDCGSGWVPLQRRLDSPVPLELAERRPGSLTGVWTWNLRSLDSEGDLKSEVETWQLRQIGGKLEGHYDREVRVSSRDGRRFQCNQELSYVSRARFRVRGWVDGGRVHLEELGFTATPDPCETGYRSLDRYDGSIDQNGDIITLSWGRGAQLLYRRY